MRRRASDAGAAPLPDYADLTEIGRTAIATLFRAKEKETGRRVALKVFDADVVRRRRLDAFMQEVQVQAAISDHPNIVTVYRVLTTPDGRLVLVLELCRESLAERLRREGPLDPEAVVAIGIKLAGGLESAHRRGLIHGDVKPQSILLTSFGEPTLSDFGFSGLQRSELAADPFAVHAAPELLEGLGPSASTDVYGLASTMYEMLAGSAPFVALDGEAVASVILRILRDPPRPLPSEDVPAQLSELLDAALSKDPAQRPSSAASFAESLRTLEASFGWPVTRYVLSGEPDLPATETTQTGPSRTGSPASKERATGRPPPPPPAFQGDAAAGVPRGPGVSPPPPAERTVVAPTRAGRGMPVTRVESSLDNPPLTPPLTGDQPPQSTPEFEDPHELAAMPSAGSLQGGRPPRPHLASARFPSALWLALLVGVAAAALVAVILVFTGVI